MRDLRMRLYGHLQGMGLGYYQQTRGGQLLSRMLADAEAVKPIVGNEALNFVQSVVTHRRVRRDADRAVVAAHHPLAGAGAGAHPGAAAAGAAPAPGLPPHARRSRRPDVADAGDGGGRAAGEVVRGRAVRAAPVLRRRQPVRPRRDQDAAAGHARRPDQRDLRGAGDGGAAVGRRAAWRPGPRRRSSPRASSCSCSWRCACWCRSSSCPTGRRSSRTPSRRASACCRCSTSRRPRRGRRAPPRCAGSATRSSSATCRSATIPRRWCSRTSRSRRTRATSSPSWGPAAPARARWWTCCRASTSRRAARSPWTGATCARSPCRRCAA